MKIEFQGDTYYVRFMHQQFGGPKIRRRGSTTCSIWRNNGRLVGRTQEDPAAPLFEGYPCVTVTVECSLKDQFCRERGRNVSLGRAVKALYPHGPERDAFLAAIAAKMGSKNI